jgi:hypothetical protein
MALNKVAMRKWTLELRPSARSKGNFKTLRKSQMIKVIVIVTMIRSKLTLTITRVNQMVKLQRKQKQVSLLLSLCKRLSKERKNNLRNKARCLSLKSRKSKIFKNNSTVIMKTMDSFMLARSLLTKHYL